MNSRDSGEDQTMPTAQQFTGVVPMLICRDSAAEIAFCARAFGAVELSRRVAADGAVMHATLRVANALVMVHGEVTSFPSQAPAADGSSPVVIYLYVEDADRVLERAVAAGARLTLPPMDAPWGDRVGRIVDPAGHVWNVASRPASAPSAAQRIVEADERAHRSDPAAQLRPRAFAA